MIKVGTLCEIVRGPAYLNWNACDMHFIGRIGTVTGVHNFFPAYSGLWYSLDILPIDDVINEEVLRPIVPPPDQKTVDAFKHEDTPAPSITDVPAELA